MTRRLTEMNESLARFGHRASRIALIGAATFTASWSAIAQDQPAAKDQGVEEIVVTGSRIARPELIQPNPVMQINSEQLRVTGLQSTIDILSQAPQTENNSDSGNNNRYINGAGLEQINLRGLGTYRTL